MGIHSIMGPAVEGIQRGFNGMRRVASEIASTQQTQPTDLSRAMVELQQHAHQAKASVNVLKVADESLGTLFDERA